MKKLTTEEKIEAKRLLAQYKHELKTDPYGLGEKHITQYFNMMFTRLTGREILTGDLFDPPVSVGLE